MESDESLGYHWGSWLGDGIQPLDGLTDGDEASSLEPSLLLSLAGESVASSPAWSMQIAVRLHIHTQCVLKAAHPLMRTQNQTLLVDVLVRHAP